jgi:hypothetical protein
LASASANAAVETNNRQTQSVAIRRIVIVGPPGTGGDLS